MFCYLPILWKRSEFSCEIHLDSVTLQWNIVCKQSLTSSYRTGRCFSRLWSWVFGNSGFFSNHRLIRLRSAPGWTPQILNLLCPAFSEAGFMASCHEDWVSHPVQELIKDHTCAFQFGLGCPAPIQHYYCPEFHKNKSRFVIWNSGPILC